MGYTTFTHPAYQPCKLKA